MLRKLLSVIFLLNTILVHNAQIVEKASLMKIRDPYFSVGTQHHIYKMLPNGKKILFGELGYTMEYNNWNITNPDSIPQGMRYFVAMFSANDSLIWVKYMNGFVQFIETDSQNNIYLTGVYKSTLHTLDGDTLPLLSNTLNYLGNIFFWKMDSAGNRKWWKTTDNEAFVQAQPSGVYIKIDPEFNVYVVGYYEEFIRFNSQISFINQSPFFGYICFLVKFDSSGNYKWVRDWNLDTGGPCSLTIDSCRIYMFNVGGSSQTHTRMRKYDFSGKLLEKKSYPYSSIGLAGFLFNNYNVKNNRFVMVTSENGQSKIGYYNLNGDRIWSINYSRLALTNLQFTNQNRIFFSGVVESDTSKIGTTPVPGDICWGLIDTSGNVVQLKTINNLRFTGNITLGLTGKLMTNNLIDYYSNSNSSFFVLDTITFNNLSYYDPGSGVISGRYYRLLAQFNYTDGAYFDPGVCSFNQEPDSCLDREGLVDCLSQPPGTFSLSATPQCNGINSQIKLSWTPSPRAVEYEIKRNGLFLANTNGTEYINTTLTPGNTYTYTITARNSFGTTGNANGAVPAIAPNCPVTAIIEPQNNPFEIRVFPNPSVGEFSITAKKVFNKVISIEILNSVGQIMMINEHRSLANDFSRTMNINKAANGLYFIKINIDNKSYLMSIVKQ